MLIVLIVIIFAIILANFMFGFEPQIKGPGKADGTLSLLSFDKYLKGAAGKNQRRGVFFFLFIATCCYPGAYFGTRFRNWFVKK